MLVEGLRRAALFCITLCLFGAGEASMAEIHLGKLRDAALLLAHEVQLATGGTLAPEQGRVLLAATAPVPRISPRVSKAAFAGRQRCGSFGGGAVRRTHLALQLPLAVCEGVGGAGLRVPTPPPRLRGLFLLGITSLQTFQDERSLAGLYECAHLSHAAACGTCKLYTCAGALASQLAPRPE